MQRYSKKRQAVLDCVRATNGHPTAEWIYASLKPSFPDLSLATVYRNLNQLEEAGLIRSMGSVNGQKRYDADLTMHPHAVCTRCGSMADVEGIPFSAETIRRVEEAIGFQIESASLHFTGLCRNCKEKGRKQE